MELTAQFIFSAIMAAITFIGTVVGSIVAYLKLRHPPLTVEREVNDEMELMRKEYEQKISTMEQACSECRHSVSGRIEKVTFDGNELAKKVARVETMLEAVIGHKIDNLEKQILETKKSIERMDDKMDKVIAHLFQIVEKSRN